MAEIGIELLGGFRVVSDGREIAIPASTRRLVAFLALRGRPAERTHLAGCLYLDKSEERAQANLRSVLWRLRRCEPQLVEADAARVWVRAGVGIDVDRAIGMARTLIDDTTAVADPSVATVLFTSDLLPEWYDDFVIVERERLRQLRLHALEAAGRRLLRQGRHAEALDAALTAVAHEPVRESAHRLTIEIHLDEGNPSEAVRQYGILERILHEELGVAPSPGVQDLVGDLGRRVVVA